MEVLVWSIVRAEEWKVVATVVTEAVTKAEETSRGSAVEVMAQQEEEAWVARSQRRRR